MSDADGTIAWATKKSGDEMFDAEYFAGLGVSGWTSGVIKRNAYCLAVAAAQSLNYPLGIGMGCRPGRARREI